MTEPVKDDDRDHPVIAGVLAVFALLLVAFIIVEAAGAAHGPSGTPAAPAATPLPSDPRAICQMVWDNRAANPLVADQTHSEFMNNCLSGIQYEQDGNPADLNGTTR